MLTMDPPDYSEHSGYVPFVNFKVTFFGEGTLLMVFNLSNEVLHFFVALFAFCRHACLTRRDRTFKYSQTDSYEALAFKVSPSNEGKWFSRSQKKWKLHSRYQN